jgi:ABC-2 type transport system permease protein
MKRFVSGLAVVLALELRQRVRGTGWYVLLGIFAALVALVTFTLWFSLGAQDEQSSGLAGRGIFSTLIYFVLLLGTLVAPALSGNAINGDRDAGTLATTQVTLVTTWQLVLGKFLAAWIAALAFLAAAVPFLVFGVASGGVRLDTIIVSVLVLAFELGVIDAIGVGLSGVLSKPLFSIVVTYLAVAAISIGSLIGFGLAGLADQSEARVTYIAFDPDINPEGTEPGVCAPPVTSTSSVPRFDHYWGILVANPYVVLADASPALFDEHGSVQDLFGTIKVGVRSAQLPPDLDRVIDDCQGLHADAQRTAKQIIESTVPGWFVGLTIHLAMAAMALVGAWFRTRTPAKRLTRGSRIA